MPENDEEPKLIIDEDWKSQVEREKEELRKKEEAAATEGAPGDSEATADSQSANSNEAGAGGGEESMPQFPPASLEMLVNTLASQAVAAMGQMPGEDGKPLPKNLPVAKHFVDLLGVLEEKTKGNLSDDEAKMVGDILHQLRMLFVTASQQP